MIKSFASSETKKIFEGRTSKEFPAEIQKTARRKLLQLDAATTLKDLGSLPGNRLHALKHPRNGQHSISINMQWRICFVWTPEGPANLEIVDYH